MPGLEQFLQGFSERRKNNAACPYCGATAESITSTGLVGCPLCYECHADLLARTFTT
jgi:protein-arginine kinase activator protein McsA